MKKKYRIFLWIILMVVFSAGCCIPLLSEKAKLVVFVLLWFFCFFGAIASFAMISAEIGYDEGEWRDLAPKLIRQRCKIELLVDHVVTPEEIKNFLPKLSEVLGMEMLNVSAYEAVIDGEFVGYGGWVHWVTSGAHVYSYTAERTQCKGLCLFSVDPYTCKPFQLDVARTFTRNYFDVPRERIVAKGT